MKYPHIDKFRPNDSYFEEIQPNVWLMDNHRWAYFIWEKFFQTKKVKTPLSLIHIDYHWDGINDFSSSEAQKELRKIDNLDDIFKLVSDENGIQHDSFIAPAIIRELINEIHFYCFQTETTPGIDPDLLTKYSSRQFMHDCLESLLKSAPNNSLISFDIDVFNKSEFFAKGDIWPESEMLRLINACGSIFESSQLITIAMSFNYSGTENDTKEISKLIVPEIIKIRSGLAKTDP